MLFLSWLGLKMEALTDAECTLLTDGNSSIKRGNVGLAMPLSPQRSPSSRASSPTLVCLEAKLWALIQVLIWAKAKEVNIGTDSRYAAIHVHGMLDKDHGLLIAEGKQIQNKGF